MTKVMAVGAVAVIAGVSVLVWRIEQALLADEDELFERAFVYPDKETPPPPPL